LNRSLVEALVEVPAQIEISILPGSKLGEIDRVVGRNKTWHGDLDRGVEQNRLCFHDHVPQSRQGGHHARRTRASQRHLGSAAQVDAGNCYAELLQSLKPVSRSAVANQSLYAGSPVAQSSRDASARLPVAPAKTTVVPFMVPILATIPAAFSGLSR